MAMTEMQELRTRWLLSSWGFSESDIDAEIARLKTYPTASISMLRPVPETFRTEPNLPNAGRLYCPTCGVEEETVAVKDLVCDTSKMRNRHGRGPKLVR